MTNRDKINFLKQYITAGHEFDEIYDSFMKCKARVEDVQAQIMSDMPKGGGYEGDTIGEAIAKLEVLRELADTRLNKLADLRKQIEQAIDTVSNGEQRRVLHLRYIEGYTWESIAVKINFTYRHTTRMHGVALNNLVLQNINKKISGD